MFTKVHARIWGDAKFRNLTDDAKLALLHILTRPGRDTLGANSVHVEGLAAEIRWKPAKYEEALSELELADIVEVDRDAGIVWAPAFTRYHPADNPSVLKSFGAAITALPESPMLASIVRKTRDILIERGKKEWLDKLPPEFDQIEARYGEEADEEAYKAAPPPRKEAQEKPKEQPAKAKTSAKKGDDYSPEFEELWNQYPAREGGNNKRTAYRSYCARRKEGVEHSKLMEATAAYKTECLKGGKIGTPYVKQAATFFGANRHYEDALNQESEGQGGSKTPRRPSDDDRAGWSALMQQHGITHKQAAGKSFDQLWSMICDAVDAGGAA